MLRPGFLIGMSCAGVLAAAPDARANLLSQPELYLVERATPWTVGLGVDALSGPSPGALAGPGLFVERSFELSSRLRPVLRIGVRKLFELPDDDRPVTELSTSTLEGCASRQWRWRWVAAACLALDAGVLDANGPPTRRFGWLAGAASLRLEWADRRPRDGWWDEPPLDWWDRPLGVGWELAIGLLTPLRGRLLLESADTNPTSLTVTKPGDLGLFAALRLTVPVFQRVFQRELSSHPD